MKRGKREGLSALEKLIRESYSLSSSSQGIELIKEVVSSQIDAAKAKKPEDGNSDEITIEKIKGLPIYQNLIETAVFNEEFIQAQDYLVLLGEMDLKNSAKRWVTSTNSAIAQRM